MPRLLGWDRARIRARVDELLATVRLDPDRPGYVVVPGASGPTAGDPDQGVVTIPVLLARFAESAAVPLLRAALRNPGVTVATVCGGSLAPILTHLARATRLTADERRALRELVERDDEPPKSKRKKG